ncbi:glutamate synthase large subunit [Helicovermis profundi]|uniref:Glutamate synthase large subunit n=1 Tax=Helicovermis profundi TaxID=3065157 RepID=A0AAU9E2L8_9FIRM|nr:glutamate synthase large subunit [Clostridia bacterium S502]
MNLRSVLSKEGLYNEDNERDNCGVGFICNINGDKKNKIVSDGLMILKNLRHRGAVGSDDTTGDGAGVMIQIPYEYFNSQINKLSGKKNYGVGMIFFPNDPFARVLYEGIIEKHIKDCNLSILCWRDVPTNDYALGELAKATKPFIRQIFIDRGVLEEKLFDRKLYLIRKRIQNDIYRFNDTFSKKFYICSLSSKTIVYKGQILGHLISEYYQDLADDRVVSSFCIVHERYSTNTFPSWKLSQPFRFISHNGEFNTIKSNKNWMKAREGILKSDIFGKNFDSLKPFIEENVSDSGAFDNTFELLINNNHSMEYALSLMLPNAYEKDDSISESAKLYHEYNSRIMEPWDGPSTIVFSDGNKIGAAVDRNGLRPARYIVTKEDEVIFSSEVGVLNTNQDNIVRKDIVSAGEIFLIDINNKRIIFDKDIKDKLYKSYDFKKWVEDNRYILSEEASKSNYKYNIETSRTKLRQRLFNYTKEEILNSINYMSETSSEIIGSMGLDIPLSVLSNKNQVFFNYFKQKFAQVTNPPLDSIREKNVMCLDQYIGKHGEKIDKIEITSNIKYFKASGIVIRNREIDYLKKLNNPDLKVAVIPIIFQIDSVNGIREGLDTLKKRIADLVFSDVNIVILSDLKVDKYNAPIPSLLALITVHKYLLKIKQRTKIDIIIESGEVRDVMHFALLSGYGAKLVNPYLAFDTIRDSSNSFKEFEEKKENYIEGINNGLLKIMSKIGISTLQSYCGSEMFEIIGLDKELKDMYFTKTNSSIESVSIELIEKGVLKNHRKAFVENKELSDGGIFEYKKYGESHLINSKLSVALKNAIINNSYSDYLKVSNKINNHKEAKKIRDILDFKVENEQEFSPKKRDKIVSNVESIESIIKRFVASAISYGSISKKAHADIAKAMNLMGARSNCGEGGESSFRIKSKDLRESTNSKIKQIASGRFGVDIDYLSSASELQIKIAQGAKPGEGGHLPKHKVTKDIAKVRNSLENTDLISPPPHHDIYSIEDLAQLIYDLKSANEKAKISVKLVSQLGIGTVASGVVKAHANIITISGHDGGTGAASLNSMRYAGMPWEIGLSDVQQTLLLNNLRSRVKLRVDGKMMNGKDVVIATLLGADEFGFASAILISLGCVNCRKCHLGKCQVGIATQDKNLIKNYKGKPKYIIDYFKFVAKEVQDILISIGVNSLDDIVGRTDLLKTIEKYNYKNIDLSKILYRPILPQKIGTKFYGYRNLNLMNTIDSKIFKSRFSDLENKIPFEINRKINNTDRSVGTYLSGKLAQLSQNRMDNEKETNINKIFKLNFKGYAGQSFGAFLHENIELSLYGDANDYVGKGLSGGRIIIYSDNISNNVVAGNTVLFGATRGELYINGTVGHRFAVRNSGAVAVIEGAKNHAFEYMTKGEVLVLGELGNNIGAGMSGGIIYLVNEDKNLINKLNSQYVKIRKSTNKENEKVSLMLKNHYKYTKSAKAKTILDNFNEYLSIINIIEVKS